MKVAILGAGAGGAAAVAELALAGHELRWWNRSAATLAPFMKLGGVAYEGVLGEGIARPAAITPDLRQAIEGAEVAVVSLPTFSHAPVARALAEAGWPIDRPVVLNPGHTGGALTFSQAFRSLRGSAPPVAEFSTLTYVARCLKPASVTVTGRAKHVRAAALPGGHSALEAGCRLFPGALPVKDVLASSLSNANLVLHPPGAVLGASWVEATQGGFTFYVQGMTPGVGRVMKALDAERLAVAAAFGHALPNLVEEMQAIGTVEEGSLDPSDFAGAISAGRANRSIKAPDSLEHRYYKEDFGYGVLPFIALAAIAGVPTPVAQSLYTLGEALTGASWRESGRSAAAMGIEGLSRTQLIEKVTLA